VTTPMVDAVTFEVVWHRLLDITEEMGIKYMRTSGSPVLVGAYDASTGITLPDGRLVAMGPYITTQGHVLRLIIESTIRLRGDRPGFRPGDMYICNDPYLGATHQPDVATVAPVYADEALSAWVGSSGHWLDIGGPEPGGFTMTARSVFDEGLRMPPTQLVDAGTIREDVVELIMSQLREQLAELDLRGQIVANQWGIRRMQDLYADYGVAAVTNVMEQALSHVSRRLRARLRELPDGVWREVQYLDHDGHGPNLRQIVCTMTKRGESLKLDFTGSAPEVAGFANCSYSGLRAACLSAICIALGFDLPWNDGAAEIVEIVAPPRTIVTAGYPTPVSLATISAIIVTLNLVLATLSKALLGAQRYHEEAMATWCGTSLGVSVIGVNERGILTVLAEASHFAAGCGARTYADGVDTGGIIINTTANIPSIEQSEAEYPVLYLFRRQLPDSGGPGKWRGGQSAGVALMPYGGSGHESSFSGVGSETPNAVGLAGGLPGATVRYQRFDEAGDVAALAGGGTLPDRVSAIPGEVEVRSINTSHSRFPPDAVEYHNWQGGGGYGDPIERDESLVARDVRRQAVTRDIAHSVYGVVINERGEPDRRATDVRRSAIREERLARGARASEVLDVDEDWAHATRWVADETSSGSTSYGAVVRFDFAKDEASCAKCATVLGPSRRDFRLGTLVEESRGNAAGPIRGEDYERGEVVLRRFYCPGCAAQLEAEVTVRGALRSAFALAGPPDEP
jgi:N-methylhydantoinase B